MNTTRRGITPAVIALTLAALPALLAAQNRDTLWTKATAEGRTISLVWDRAHPWDATLGKGGATLLARYRVDARREVTEPLARGVAVSGERRAIRFRLPEGVKSPPVGPVCLVIQMPDRRLLPVRRATTGGDDTAGFRYEAWEQQIRQQAAAQAARSLVASAERALHVSEQSVASQVASIARRGWSTLEGCENMPVPAAATGAPMPFDVVPPDEQDDVARRVCVRRVWQGWAISAFYLDEQLPKRIEASAARRDIAQARRDLSAAALPFVGLGGEHVTELTNLVVSRLGMDNPTVLGRQPQVQRFLRDWERWSGSAERYEPQLGDEDDYLDWPSTAASPALRIFGPSLAKALGAEWAIEGLPAATTRDLEAYLAASLDAYEGCVDDGRKQLKLKYDNWQKEQADAPRLAAAQREFLVRECRQEVGLVDKLKTERETLQAQLETAREALARASTPVPLPSRPQALNGAGCAVEAGRATW